MLTYTNMVKVKTLNLVKKLEYSSSNICATQTYKAPSGNFNSFITKLYIIVLQLTGPEFNK